ncbi:MAG TPA: PorP/SprF family type IX secretion system membrane protein [Flavitalea sp.]|nr:PorP/SprF family type IX secretion system membrane protein [Flavitalea sp.]
MKTRLSITLTAWLLITLAPRVTKAQIDPHFSQYFIQPMTLNPALTGAMDGKYRVSAIWRNQYGNSLTTLGIAGEAITNKNMNFGVNLLHQYSAGKAYQYTNANLTAAYTGVSFGNHHLVMALQMGALDRRFNMSKFQFGEQWTAGVGFDPSVISGETLNNSGNTSFDAGAGIIYYDGTPDKRVHVFGGYSASHLTRPMDPFISEAAKQRLPVRHSFHAGARITVSDLFDLVPNALYMQQGNAREKMVGAYFQLSGGKETDIMFGANMRFKDAVSPFAGFYHKGLTVGFSYDVNGLDNRVNTAGRNSMEVSISFVGLRSNNESKTKPFYCPRF